MRILGHIHTFNDEDVISRSMKALLDQTHALDEILIVDNASTDGTLDRTFPEIVTVVRHPENLGTSGAVVTGFQYALDHRYDWIWVFDADSAPRQDALARLLVLYDSLPPSVQEATRLLASLPMDCTTKTPYHGVVFDRDGFHQLRVEGDEEYYEFDGGMWTGSLFKVDAVRKIGLPSSDYVLDWGEYEYGYKGKRAHLKAFMHLRSIVDHNIGGRTSLVLATGRLGPLSFPTIEFPAIRCYYFVRNTLYFWLHEYRPFCLRRSISTFRETALFTLNFMTRPIARRTEWIACLMGMRDGILKNMGRRYRR